MIGQPIPVGSSGLFAGPLGMVQVAFKGYDLGKTTGETVLKEERDIKDIVYAQDGTRPADKVCTGSALLLDLTLAEIKPELVALLKAGAVAGKNGTGKDYFTFGRSMYQSMRENEAGPLKVAACKANGLPSEEAEDTFSFYEAIPVISDNLLNWGPDSQRALKVQFLILFHKFAAGESATKDGDYGYGGLASDADVPAIAWPDVAAPVIISAAVASGTLLNVTFDKNVSEVDALSTEDKVIVSVDGAFVSPTSSEITGAVLALTFPASTFTAGDAVLLNMSAGVVEDASDNQNAVVSARVVTNPLT